MSYRVKIVESKQELKEFLYIPHVVYQNDPAWIAPLHSETIRTLDPVRNPYFKGVDIQKYICYKDSQPAARAISVINPRHWEKSGKKTAFFGFFEAINNQEAVKILFDAISAYCKRKSIEILEGPFNPNHYSELGLLVRNFSEPVFFETYNPEYYVSLLKGVGFNVQYSLHTRVNKDALGFINKTPVYNLTKLKAKGYTLRQFNLLHMERDLECIRKVFNDAFSENWHFLTLSSEEYKFSAKSLFLVSKPGLIQIVEHQGRPVGVLQCIPNVNPLLKQMKGRHMPWDLLRFLWKRRSIREIVIYAVGIKKSYQNGIVTLMLFEALREILKTYPVLYTTWMTSENIPAIKRSESFGLMPYKWFDIYSKTVSPPDQ